VQRAIPPDLSHAQRGARETARQREAIGDLHLAADNFTGAIEAYRDALKGIGLELPSERARLLQRLADASLRRGDHGAAIQALGLARAAARLVDDARLPAHIAARLAHAHIEQGRIRRSRRYAQFAYAVLRGTDEHRTVGQVLVTLGLCAARLGRSQEAIERLQSAVATFRRIEDSDGLVTALNNLGLVHKNLREWRDATRFLEEALRLDERVGLYARMRGHNQNLGLIRFRLGQWDLAEENFANSLKIARETGHQQGEAVALLAMGMLSRRRRQFEQADEQYRRALKLAAQSGALREQLLAREFIGELEVDMGNYEGAIDLLEPALEEAVGIAPEGDVVAEIEIRLGIAHLRAGHVEPAEAHLLHGAQLAERLGDRIEVAIAGRALARLDATRGNAPGMEARLKAAAQACEQLGELYEQAVTLGMWGECMLALPSSARMRLSLDAVTDATRRASVLYRRLGLAPAAAGLLLTLAKLVAEREHFDQALGLLEQTEEWLAEESETDHPAAKERAVDLRQEIERQYVAVSLSTCNEFRALEEANRLFRETSDMNGLLAQTVKLAVEHAGGDRGFVAFSAGGGRLEVVAQHGLGRDRARRMLKSIVDASGQRLAENGPLFSSRVSADPRFETAITDSLEGVGSLVCVPLNFPSQAMGLVYVDRLNDNLLGAFKQRELNMLAVLANSGAVAIVEAQRSLLLAENKELRDKLKPSPGLGRVVTQSREMEQTLQLLTKVGDSNATVLFMGETGTGKGLLAQVVHEISNRRDQPFVQVNCAAIPESLLESELFGHLQGSFTGANRDKMGLFEEANDGTIFLDEIEKVPESVQAKLLHVLDQREIRPVGATRSRHVNARVICATGCDLRERIQQGRFLEDLYYRLNDITVKVPPLRERREDIPGLAQHFIAMFSRQMEKRVGGIPSDVMRLFLEHEWRGNVRELEKTVKRMVVLADEGEPLTADLLPPEIEERRSRTAARASGSKSRTLRSNISDLERRMIADALERYDWNKARAARELGLSYPTMLSKIRLLKIEKAGATVKKS
jgi:transcriptional regulator with GAF, ATPase, and Fis domain